MLPSSEFLPSYATAYIYCFERNDDEDDSEIFRCVISPNVREQRSGTVFIARDQTSGQSRVSRPADVISSLCAVSTSSRAKAARNA